MNVFTAGQQMFVMFLLIIVGYLCYRYKLISAENNSCLSRLVINVFNPAMIFASVLANSGERSTDSVLTLFLVSAGLYLFLVICAKLLVMFSGKSAIDKSITQLLYVFANVGFIGIPVVKALLGDDKLIYVAVFNLEYNILFYTYGTQLLQRSIGNVKTSIFSKDSLKPLLNMGTFASVAALIVFLGNYSVPAPLADGIQTLANATTPLSLIVIGVSLGIQGHIFSLFTSWHRYLFCLWKLLLLPLAATWILKKLPISPELCQTYMIMMAMPCGNMSLMLVKQYELPEEEGSSTIILSTLLSILTIPVMVLLYPYL